MKIYKVSINFEDKVYMASAEVLKETPKTFLIKDADCSPWNHASRLLKTRDDIFFTKEEAIDHFTKKHKGLLNRGTIMVQNENRYLKEVKELAKKR